MSEKERRRRQVKRHICRQREKEADRNPDTEANKHTKKKPKRRGTAMYSHNIRTNKSMRVRLVRRKKTITARSKKSKGNN